MSSEVDDYHGLPKIFCQISIVLNTAESNGSASDPIRLMNDAELYNEFRLDFTRS